MTNVLGDHSLKYVLRSRSINVFGTIEVSSLMKLRLKWASIMEKLVKLRFTAQTKKKILMEAGGLTFVALNALKIRAIT